MPPFWMGFMVGVTSAVIGSIVEWRLLRRQTKDVERVPGCMMLMAGGLGFVGALSILIGLIVRSLPLVLLLGLGVITGFWLGFILMAIIWYLFVRQ